MSAECKSRLEVQTIIRNSILECFRLYKQDGWEVMEFANASFQRANKIILMNLVNTIREGWQAVHYAEMEDGYKRRDEWIETQSWQIHTLLKRTNDTQDTAILAEDIAQLLISWFNGRGCEDLRRNRMASLVIDAESILVYNDNSDLYQKRAVFTVKIQVPKELTTDDASAEMIQPRVEPV